MNPPSGPTEHFEDRKTGLIVFGVLTVLIGLLCALFVPLMFFGQAMSAKGGAPQSTQTILPAVVMYGTLAVILVWLGIGSMMARRWARALLLIFSWSWLLMGVISIVMMAIMWPRLAEMVDSTSQPNQPPASLILLIPMIVLGCIFVIIPSIWVFFYKSRHVIATCEARDPVTRWTDRAPLPIVAVCVWLVFSAPMMLLMAVAYRSVIPVFGTFVSGPIGSVIYLLLGALWAYSALSLYKLEWRGWWIVTVAIILFATSAFTTYTRHDVTELYTLMGYPEEQIAQIQKFNFLKGQSMAWASLCGTIPFLGFLFYVRRFLKSSQAQSSR